MAQLKVENLTFKYPGENATVLDDVSFEVASGDFVVICGPSGCGKTTLLKLLKKELQPVGNLTGQVSYMGQKLDETDERILIEEIGMVFQDPDNQIVLDEVLQEIVFAMENLNYRHFEMQKRVAEMVSYFGVEDLLYEKPSSLSGGQKQLINLLSALLLRPKILLLDEPTSQLDPVAAKELLAILEKINTEMGTTIIIVEHRLEELFSVADQVLMMSHGKIVERGLGQAVARSCAAESTHPFHLYTPSFTRLFMARETRLLEAPLTVKAARKWLNESCVDSVFKTYPETAGQREGSNVIEVKDLHFRYEKEAAFVLNRLNLQIHQGEYFALVGGNGSGKTTLLKACMGLVKAQRGKVILNGEKVRPKQIYENIAYLPQNPKTYFIHDTIGEEMMHVVKSKVIENGSERVDDLLNYFEIAHLRARHPYDCSGGEMQRAVLACLLLGQPEILFIDEPTKGLDPVAKDKFASLLNDLHEAGLTIVMVTHDIEFTAKHASRCAILFNGNISAMGRPDELFKENYFYTTAINRATRDVVGLNALTLEEAYKKWPKKS